MMSLPRSPGWAVDAAPSEGAAGRRAEPVPRLAAALLVVALVGAAALLRLHGLPHDLPHSYFGDELHLVSRAMAMGTGDLNPHWFNKPAFLMYLLLFCYGLFFVAGLLLGQFASPEAFGAYFLADQGAFILIGRLVVAAFGVATVYVAHLTARRAFGTAAGVGAALVTAVLLPMVVGSQVVKADVPAGFFVALSVCCYLRAREDQGLRPLLLAAAFAGVAMGTKYYGIAVLPVFALAELARRFTDGAPWSRVTLRGALLVAAFVAAFFTVSPYHFLDPSWSAATFDRLSGLVTAAEGAVDYAIDSRMEYGAGLIAAPGAAAHLLGQVLAWDALGGPLAVLVALGVAAALARRETRWHALVLAGPAVVFALLAISYGAYHADARHLNAIYPLLAAFVVPGARTLARGLGLADRRATPAAALAIAALAAAPSAALAVEANLARLRPDSRTVAARWIATNLPRAELILLDDHGPTLPPGPAAVERQRARLATLGPPDAFTAPEARRLAVLARHPIADGFNVDRLGHPWWLPREASDAELRRGPRHRRMSNPLWSREPRPLAAYRAAGVRYVVTNTRAQERYEEPGAAADFPSFVRFYGELARLEPLKVVDPAEWNGKGPVVLIYDLLRNGRADDAGPSADG